MENELKVIDKRMAETPETSIQVQDNSPASMMIAAMSRGMDPDMIERFMELQERYEKNEAKKAYNGAVAAFKENPPQILKDKENSQFKSKYVTLGNLLKTVNPELGKHGLSVSFNIDQETEKSIKVSCILSHRQGHSESVSMSAPPDTSGGNSKNPIQQIKSTITYLRAATFEAVTGLAATDSNLDDDGNGVGVEYITEAQAKILNDIIEKKNVDLPQFLSYMKAETVEEILPKDFAKAMQALKIAKGRPKVVMCPNTEKNVPLSDCEGCEGRKGCPNHDNN